MENIHTWQGIDRVQSVCLGMIPLDIKATRVWTIKEAAAKALDMDLLQAIQEVEVVRVGEIKGVMRYQGNKYPIRHAEGNGYVITLVTCDAL